LFPDVEDFFEHPAMTSTAKMSARTSSVRFFMTSGSCTRDCAVHAMPISGAKMLAIALLQG
jgi:hypothetical protein